MVDQCLTTYLAATSISGHPTLVQSLADMWTFGKKNGMEDTKPQLPSWSRNWSTFKAYKLKVGFEIDATKKEERFLLTQVRKESCRQSLGTD